MYLNHSHSKKKREKKNCATIAPSLEVIPDHLWHFQKQKIIWLYFKCHSAGEEFIHLRECKGNKPCWCILATESWIELPTFLCIWAFAESYGGNEQKQSSYVMLKNSRVWRAGSWSKSRNAGLDSQLHQLLAPNLWVSQSPL